MAQQAQQTHYRIVRMAGRDVVHTSRVAIGVAHVPRQRASAERDAIYLQAALLEKRTAQPATGWRAAASALAAAVWRWL